METSAEAWAACRVMTKPQLVKIAQRPGYDMLEETARTELRKRAASVAAVGRSFYAPVFHDLESCDCETCNALWPLEKGVFLAGPYTRKDRFVGPISPPHRRLAASASAAAQRVNEARAEILQREATNALLSAGGEV